MEPVPSTPEPQGAKIHVPLLTPASLSVCVSVREQPQHACDSPAAVPPMADGPPGQTATATGTQALDVPGPPSTPIRPPASATPFVTSATTSAGTGGSTSMVADRLGDESAPALCAAAANDAESASRSGAASTVSEAAGDCTAEASVLAAQVQAMREERRILADALRQHQANLLGWMSGQRADDLLPEETRRNDVLQSLTNGIEAVIHALKQPVEPAPVAEQSKLVPSAPTAEVLTTSVAVSAPCSITCESRDTVAAAVGSNATPTALQGEGQALTILREYAEMDVPGVEFEVGGTRVQLPAVQEATYQLVPLVQQAYERGLTGERGLEAKKLEEFLIIWLQAMNAPLLLPPAPRLGGNDHKKDAAADLKQFIVTATNYYRAACQQGVFCLPLRECIRMSDLLPPDAFGAPSGDLAKMLVQKYEFHHQQECSRRFVSTAFSYSHVKTVEELRKAIAKSVIEANCDITLDDCREPTGQDIHRLLNVLPEPFRGTVKSVLQRVHGFNIRHRRRCASTISWVEVAPFDATRCDHVVRLIRAMLEGIVGLNFPENLLSAFHDILHGRWTLVLVRHRSGDETDNLGHQLKRGDNGLEGRGHAGSTHEGRGHRRERRAISEHDEHRSARDYRDADGEELARSQHRHERRADSRARAFARDSREQNHHHSRRHRPSSSGEDRRGQSTHQHRHRRRDRSHGCTDRDDTDDPWGDFDHFDGACHDRASFLDASDCSDHHEHSRDRRGRRMDDRERHHRGGERRSHGRGHHDRHDHRWNHHDDGLDYHDHGRDGRDYHSNEDRGDGDRRDHQRDPRHYGDDDHDRTRDGRDHHRPHDPDDRGRRDRRREHHHYVHDDHDHGRHDHHRQDDRDHRDRREPMRDHDHYIHDDDDHGRHARDHHRTADRDDRDRRDPRRDHDHYIHDDDDHGRHARGHHRTADRDHRDRRDHRSEQHHFVHDDHDHARDGRDHHRQHVRDDRDRNDHRMHRCHDGRDDRDNSRGGKDRSHRQPTNDDLEHRRAKYREDVELDREITSSTRRSRHQ